MARQPKGFGSPAQPKRNSKKSKSKPLALGALTDMEPMFPKELRLKQLFQADDRIPSVTPSSLQQYHQIFQNQIEQDPTFRDLKFRIDEPLLWEEIYVYGPGSAQSHEQLRQQQPSYLDRYGLIDLHPQIEENTGLQVIVDRLTDKQRFTLPLHLLRSMEASQLIADYRFWWTHYRPIPFNQQAQWPVS